MWWILKLAITIIFLVILIRIVSPMGFFQRVLSRNAGFNDKLTVIVIFGLFSVFCTYMGTELPSGAIINVRIWRRCLPGWLADR